MEELGGLNLYAFVRNRPNVLLDLLGGKSVPYLWVSEVEREFVFFDWLDLIKFKWKWLNKLKDLLGYGSSIIDVITKSTTLDVRTEYTDVPDCYVVVNDHVRDETKDYSVWIGAGTELGEFLSLFIEYEHVLEWKWGPDPKDPCCK